MKESDVVAQSYRIIVGENTTYAKVSGPGDIYYEPFIEDGKVGFYIRDHHGRADIIYLEPCSNIPAVWVHDHPLEDGTNDPVTFFNVCEDWSEEGWQVKVNNKPLGPVHSELTDAEAYADAVIEVHTPEHEVEIVSTQLEQE